MAPTEDSLKATTPRSFYNNMSMNHSAFSSGTFSTNYATSSASTSTCSIPLHSSTTPKMTGRRGMKPRRFSGAGDESSTPAYDLQAQMESLRWDEAPVHYTIPPTDAAEAAAEAAVAAAAATARRANRDEDGCAADLHMKTIRMLALIRGTTTEAVIESEMSAAFDRIVQEQAAADAAAAARIADDEHDDIEDEDDDDNEPDFLIGDSFEDPSPRGGSEYKHANPYRVDSANEYRRSPDLDEIFDLDM